MIELTRTTVQKRTLWVLAISQIFGTIGVGVAPSIGILLAESMRYLTAGAWWLAVLPGLCLLVGVKLVDAIGASTRALLDPLPLRSGLEEPLGSGRDGQQGRHHRERSQHEQDCLNKV